MKFRKEQLITNIVAISSVFLPKMRHYTHYKLTINPKIDTVLLTKSKSASYSNTKLGFI
jgi:hypothetical protein